MNHRSSPRLWLYIWVMMCLTGPTAWGAARSPYMQPSFASAYTHHLPTPDQSNAENISTLRVWGEWFAGLAVMCLFGLTIVGLTGGIVWLPILFGVGMVVSGLTAMFLGAFSLARQPGDDQSLMVLSVGLFMAVLGGVLLPLLNRD